jgi:hypothetical protein
MENTRKPRPRVARLQFTTLGPRSSVIEIDISLSGPHIQTVSINRLSETFCERPSSISKDLGDAQLGFAYLFIIIIIIIIII